MSDIAKLCYVCGKIAKNTCKMCGKPVCGNHYNAEMGSCPSHAGRSFKK